MADVDITIDLDSKKAQSSAKKLSSSLKKLDDKTKLAGKSIDKTSSSSKKMGSVFERVKSSAGGLVSAKQALVATGVALVAIVTKSVSSFVKFEKTLLELKALTGESTNAIAGQSSQFSALAISTGTSATEIARAYTQIRSAGISGARANDILNASIKGNIGGFGELATTTKAVIGIMSNFKGTGAKEAISVILAETDAGTATLEQFAKQIPEIGGLFSAVGGKASELSGSFAKLTEGTLVASEAKTQLKALLTELGSPRTRSKIASALNIDAGELSISEQGFTKVVETIGKGLSQKDFLANSFGSIEARSAIIGLSKESEETGRTLRELSEKAQKLASDESFLSKKVQDAQGTWSMMAKMGEFLAFKFRDIGSFAVTALKLPIALLASSFADLIPTIKMIIGAISAGALLLSGAIKIITLIVEKIMAVANWITGGILQGAGTADSSSEGNLISDYLESQAQIIDAEIAVKPEMTTLKPKKVKTKQEKYMKQIALSY